MTHEFDEAYWDQHWQQRPLDDAQGLRPIQPNPYLIRETGDLTVGTALDAGCGEGDEAIWLAANGWSVTGADISIQALARAADRAAGASRGMQLSWVEADLTQWEPESLFDLVTTHYAHPSIPQVAFYARIAQWVAPSGTLLIVGHLHSGGHGSHDDHPPAEAAVTAAQIIATLDSGTWEIVTAEEQDRSLESGGTSKVLHDVIVRARRRS